MFRPVEHKHDDESSSDEHGPMEPSYYVKALWDPEASVWTSESDIPGLVIEANTLTEFDMLLWELAPEMLAANEKISGGRVAVEFSAATRREFAVAG